MVSFSSTPTSQVKLATSLIKQYRGNHTLLGELNRGLSNMEDLIYNRAKGTKLPNATILGDIILKNTDAKIRLNNRLLVTSNPTKPGVIRLLDIYSHKHGEIMPHSHFYETTIIFPNEKQSTVESLIKDLLKRSKAEI